MQTARANTLQQLQKYNTALEMEENVERIARETGLVGRFELRMSDDLAEELVVQALQLKA